jgi:hypothetical protein
MAEIAAPHEELAPSCCVQEFGGLVVTGKGT